jgi:hypothetical protein
VNRIAFLSFPLSVDSLYLVDGEHLWARLAWIQGCLPVPAYGTHFIVVDHEESTKSTYELLVQNNVAGGVISVETSTDTGSLQ